MVERRRASQRSTGFTARMPTTDLQTWAINCYLFGTLAETWLGSGKVGILADTPVWGTGIPSGNLTDCAIMPAPGYHLLKTFSSNLLK